VPSFIQQQGSPNASVLGTKRQISSTTTSPDISHHQSWANGLGYREPFSS